MAKDKFSAIWVSHSSIGDYLKCPRAYYLKNVYRNPRTHKKVSIITPALALGQSVHEVVESLSQVPVNERLKLDLVEIYNLVWEKVTGKKGGFVNAGQEEETKTRGRDMLLRIIANPGPIERPAIKIRQDLPYFWLSEEENIILCGKIDWLEYLPDTDSVNILDFKTGKYDEDPGSLQLPIYLLVASRCQSKQVSGAFYWYLDRDNSPTKVELPVADQATSRLLPIAKKIALARKLDHFTCPKINGCRNCLPLESIVSGDAELVGNNSFGQEIYILK